MNDFKILLQTSASFFLSSAKSDVLLTKKCLQSNHCITCIILYYNHCTPVFSESVSKLLKFLQHTVFSYYVEYAFTFVYFSHISISHKILLRYLSLFFSFFRQLLHECGIGVDDAGESDHQSTGGLTGGSVVSQHRVLLFCQYKSILDIIEKDLFKYENLV